jgi:hypothetical protein
MERELTATWRQDPEAAAGVRVDHRHKRGKWWREHNRRQVFFFLRTGLLDSVRKIYWATGASRIRQRMIWNEYAPAGKPFPFPKKKRQEAPTVEEFEKRFGIKMTDAMEDAFEAGRQFALQEASNAADEAGLGRLPGLPLAKPLPAKPSAQMMLPAIPPGPAPPRIRTIPPRREIPALKFGPKATVSNIQERIDLLEDELARARRVERIMSIEGGALPPMSAATRKALSPRPKANLTSADLRREIAEMQKMLEQAESEKAEKTRSKKPKKPGAAPPAALQTPEEAKARTDRMMELVRRAEMRKKAAKKNPRRSKKATKKKTTRSKKKTSQTAKKKGTNRKSMKKRTAKKKAAKKR